MTAAREAVPDAARFPDGPIHRKSLSEVLVILGEGSGLYGEWKDVQLQWQRGRWVVISVRFITA